MIIELQKDIWLKATMLHAAFINSSWNLGSACLFLLENKCFVKNKKKYVKQLKKNRDVGSFCVKSTMLIFLSSQKEGAYELERLLSIMQSIEHDSEVAHCKGSGRLSCVVVTKPGAMKASEQPLAPEVLRRL